MLMPLIHILQMTNGIEFSYMARMGNVFIQSSPSLEDIANQLALAYKTHTGFALPASTPVHLRLVMTGETHTTLQQLYDYEIDDSALFPRTEDNLRKIAEGQTFYCDATQNKLVWNHP